MTDWPKVRIESCLDHSIPVSFAKISTQNYKRIGKYPIVDQGRKTVSGWTDDETSVIPSTYLPVIVFGDHTRAFKYVDFPFARGADGTQILKPKSGIDPLFFYFACKTIQLPNRGYNRHLRALSEKVIPVPPIEDQRAIGRCVRTVDEAVSCQDEQLEAVADVRHTARRLVFTHGLQNESRRHTSLGVLPHSWCLDRIGEHFSVVSGGTPPRQNHLFWKGGTIPWVKTTEVDYCVIHATAEHITMSALDKSAAKLLPEGTLLLAMYGQGVTRGKVALLGIPAACNQACAAMNPIDDVVHPKYLYHFLSFRYDAIRRAAHGGQQQNLNLEIVRNFLVSYPREVDEQRTIVAMLDSIDEKLSILEKKRNVLDALSGRLSRDLLIGDARVADLDLTALPPTIIRHGQFEL